MSSEPQEDVHVRIAVKSVYERNLSVELQMLGNSTILQLKQSLQERLPSGALPKHQRLIFGGKICDDTQTLAQVLKRMEPNETYTFHLLVSQPNKPPPSAAPVAAPASVPIAPSAPVVPPPGVPASTPHEQPSIPASTSPLPQLDPATAAALHTMHLQHYLAQQEVMLLMQIQHLRHIQQYQQLHGIRAPETPAVAAPSLFPMHLGALHLHAVGGGFPAANPAATANTTSPRFQAIRAIFGLIDLTLALKMCVMVYIIGQDLPPPRSYILMGLAAVIYLYMTGILIKIYDLIKGNPHVERVPPAAAAAAADNGDMFNQENDLPMGPPGPPLVTIATEGGVLKDIQSFFVGLLLSLFPSWRPLATAAVTTDLPAQQPDVVPVDGNNN
ncbi:Aste57867_8836 [Aphanomyces stellatus]|uniref:Aste57867_8836 protein n=1 Tax=Aphanomyces stellatus TaxID=120398 RepID=A0A485KLC0_9STRA|nr:hypothetical protein As57867_008801 [Aphanomyces stellatus]VFT85722.1 Aste57867_8836 [Aphanomyces stellatus]